MGNALNKTTRFIKKPPIFLIIFLLSCFMVCFPKTAIYAGSFEGNVTQLFASDAVSYQPNLHAQGTTHTATETAIYSGYSGYSGFSEGNGTQIFKSDAVSHESCIDPIWTPDTPTKTAIYAWFPEGNVEQISPPGGVFYQACIHPAGTHVICSGNLEGAPLIWEMNLSTKERVVLSPENAASIHGVYSWDGTKIVFSSDLNSGNPIPSFDVNDLSTTGMPPSDAIVNIFVMDADGSNIKQLTFGPYQDQRPTFSPDGQYIVFVRGYDVIKDPLGLHSSTLWIVPTDGSRAPEVIPMDKGAYRPWFSADGERLYFFFSESLFRHQICSVPVEGGDITPLAADDRGLSHGPFVDADGDTLLMHSTRDGKWNIYEVPLAGGEPVVLQPEGFDDHTVAHATRAVNGVIAFDSDGDLF
ncbi:MAG: hypothetical protein HKP58_09205 [Desulfatitalea sp.]|nr:PD40 domain-containing protein [Desulfatitalea sp.]NNK00578.1 hypothetical protein [Desulfatitalea sp.]